jgi:hypothetical protein
VDELERVANLLTVKVRLIELSFGLLGVASDQAQ